MPLPLKAFLVWCMILPLAIINGIFREYVLLPQFGSTAAQPISGVMLALLIICLTWFCLPFFGFLRTSQYCAIGAVWLLLTISFEFCFGRLIAHKSWCELLQAYDITGGNLWSLVLLVTALSPWITTKLRSDT